MGRSFRVAEQFVLSRAAAVIVHSTGLKEAALERGAPSDGVFLVPEPISDEDEPAAALSQDIDFLSRRFGFAPESVSFFVPQFANDGAEQLSSAAISVLEGFALASN
jgi:hypothetical protein